MADEILVGDRVEVFLNSRTWKSEGWFQGTVIRIDPYSAHRSFYWVELDEALVAGAKLISVLNPRHIHKT